MTHLEDSGVTVAEALPFVLEPDLYAMEGVTMPQLPTRTQSPHVGGRHTWGAMSCKVEPSWMVSYLGKLLAWEPAMILLAVTVCMTRILVAYAWVFGSTPSRQSPRTNFPRPQHHPSGDSLVWQRIFS